MNTKDGRRIEGSAPAPDELEQLEKAWQRHIAFRDFLRKAWAWHAEEAAKIHIRMEKLRIDEQNR